MTKRPPISSKWKCRTARKARPKSLATAACARAGPFTYRFVRNRASAAPLTTRPGPITNRARRARVLAAALISAAAVTLARCSDKGGPLLVPVACEDGKAKERPSGDWPKPDAAVIMPGQQHGYLDECGCSRAQAGWMARGSN